MIIINIDLLYIILDKEKAIATLASVSFNLDDHTETLDQVPIVISFMIIINIDLLYIILDKEKAIDTLQVFLSIWMITPKHLIKYL